MYIPHIFPEILLYAFPSQYFLRNIATRSMLVAMGDVQVLPAQSTPETKATHHKEYQFEEVEHANTSIQPDIIDAMETEPEFHSRTWIALAAFLLLNYTQVLALQGPSAVVSADGLGRRTTPCCDDMHIDIL